LDVRRAWDPHRACELNDTDVCGVVGLGLCLCGV
jgi:hypothetical protein